jgi:hypothetical protein
MIFSSLTLALSQRERGSDDPIRIVLKQQAFLPLPLGEGQGEGRFIFVKKR